MAGCLVRARSAYRLLNSGLASFGSISNTKYLFQDIGFKFRGTSPCSSLTRDGKGIQRLVSKPRVCAIPGRLNYFSTTPVATGEQGTHRITNDNKLTAKVLTDSDADVHRFICRLLIGREGQNIKKLELETGLHFDLDTETNRDLGTSLLVLGTDAEVLKSTTEKLTQEVQRIRNCIEEVFTDEDVDIHNRICGGIIGKGGQNVQRLRLETGLDFDLATFNTGLLVHVTDAEVLKSATEKVTQEVQRVRNCIGKVFTDEDVDIHTRMCGTIIGKGGQSIQRLKLETGLDFGLSRINTGLLVHVTDAEVLKSATENVAQEVQRVRNCIGKVLTDEDVDIHTRMCGTVIGKGGQNLQRLRLETGLDFKLDIINKGLLVYVTDAEVLKSATENIAQEVQRVRNCIGKVLTDEDVDIHTRICSGLIGKGGQNIQRLKLETGLDFKLDIINKGLLVYVTDAEVLKSATENIAQEVQRIKNWI